MLDGQWGKWGDYSRNDCLLPGCPSTMQLQRKDRDEKPNVGCFKVLKTVCKHGLGFLCFVLMVLTHSKTCCRSGFFRYYTSQQNGMCRKEGKGLIPCSTSRPSPEITGAKTAEQWIRPPCLSRTGIARIRNLALSCAGKRGWRGKAQGNTASHLPWASSGLFHYTHLVHMVLQLPIVRAIHGLPYSFSLS